MKKIIIIFFIVAVFATGYCSVRFLADMPQKAKLALQQKGGTYVSLSGINRNIREAAIASQDERFSTNSGIDLRGTARAIYYTLTTGKRQGASTITEQLIKNVYFSDIDDLRTDILTKILAVTATAEYPKNTILELYLNSIYYGNNTYGIEKASEFYFQRPAMVVSLDEAAYLIGLINAPSYLGSHKDAALREADLVLQSMRREKALH